MAINNFIFVTNESFESIKNELIEKLGGNEATVEPKQETNIDFGFNKDTVKFYGMDISFEAVVKRLAKEVFTRKRAIAEQSRSMPKDLHNFEMNIFSNDIKFDGSQLVAIRLADIDNKTVAYAKYQLNEDGRKIICTVDESIDLTNVEAIIIEDFFGNEIMKTKFLGAEALFKNQWLNTINNATGEYNITNLQKDFNGVEVVDLVSLYTYRLIIAKDGQKFKGHQDNTCIISNAFDKVYDTDQLKWVKVTDEELKTALANLKARIPSSMYMDPEEVFTQRAVEDINKKFSDIDLHSFYKDDSEYVGSIEENLYKLRPQILWAPNLKLDIQSYDGEIYKFNRKELRFLIVDKSKVTINQQSNYTNYDFVVVDDKFEYFAANYNETGSGTKFTWHKLPESVADITKLKEAMSL